jgi:hypothetical protein
VPTAERKHRRETDKRVDDQTHQLDPQPRSIGGAPLKPDLGWKRAQASARRRVVPARRTAATAGMYRMFQGDYARHPAPRLGAFSPRAANPS